MKAIKILYAKIILALLCLVTLFVGVWTLRTPKISSTAASLNTVSGATVQVQGETISIPSTGNRAALHYAAFEMDEYKDIRVDFTGKDMPTVRLMANTVNGNSTLTTNEGVIVYGDADNRLNVGNRYVGTSEKWINNSLGIADDLTVGVEYSMIISFTRDNSGAIIKTTATVYTRDGETLRSLGEASYATTEAGMGFDRTKPLYVIFMNNVIGGHGGTDFVYHRDDTVTGINYANGTLTWNKTVGADGYFVQVNGGEWQASSESSFAVALPDGTHTFSVCANIGGEKGEVYTQTVVLGKESRVLMRSGASIRAQGNSGIRFSAFVQEGYKEAGVLLHKGSLAQDEVVSFDNYDLNGVAVNYCTESELVGYKQFNVVLVDVPAENYAQNIAARAYVTYENGETVYSTDTVTRSIAQVATLSLHDKENEGNDTLLDYIDNSVADFTIEGGNKITTVEEEGKQLSLSVTGKAGMIEPDFSTLVPFWASSDEGVAKIDGTGKLTVVNLGTTTISATLGRTTKTMEFSVAKPESGVTENDDGTITLNGTPDKAAPYLVMDYTEVDENVLYEVAFTGRNFPGMWLGASAQSGDYKTGGATGSIVSFDATYGFAVSSKAYGSGRTPIKNADGAYGGGNDSSTEKWTLASLKEEGKYLFRAGFVKGNETVPYRLRLYLYEENANGTQTLLNATTVSALYENGVEGGVKYYMLLAGNRSTSAVTFSWRKLTLIGDSATTINGAGDTVLHGNVRTDLPYMATSYRDGEYLEATFVGGGMPTVRIGYGEITSNASSAGNGFILTNDHNTGVSIYHGGYDVSNRTGLTANRYGHNDLKANNPTDTHLLRVGLTSAGEGSYKMVAYLYRLGEDGYIKQLNEVTATTAALAYEGEVYVQMLGNAHAGTIAYDWKIKQGDIHSLAVQSQFHLYGYSGPSDGYYKDADGAQVYAGKTFQTQEEYDAYAACGMNILLLQGDDAWNDTLAQQEHVKEIMKMAVKAGLKVIIHDSRIEMLSRSETMPIVVGNRTFSTQEEINARVKECMDEYAHLEGFYGLQIHDEPTYKRLPAYGAVYKAIKAYDTNCYVQCNLLPYSGNAALYVADTSAYTLEEAYTQYLNDFLDYSGSKGLQFDSYPMLPTSILGYHVRGLQIAAEICRDRGVELYSVVQSCEFTGVENGATVVKRRRCEADDMYWQNNLLMGLGVKEIAYFTYQTKKSGEGHVDGYAFMNYDGTKTELYDFMTDIHAEMQALAPVILQYDYVGMQTYAAAGVSWLSGVTNDDFTKITSVSGIGTTYEALFVSEMYNAQTGEYGYMIMNLSDPNRNLTATAEITFNTDSLAVYTKGVRSTVSLTGGKYAVSLAGGQAVFVVAK